MSWLNRIFGVDKAEQKEVFATHTGPKLPKPFGYVDRNGSLTFIARADINEVISYERKRQEMTRVQLAKKCGVSVQYIKKIEYGECDPSLAVLRKIATALNTPLTFTITPGINGYSPNTL